MRLAHLTGAEHIHHVEGSGSSVSNVASEEVHGVHSAFGIDLAAANIVLEFKVNRTISAVEAVVWKA